jgi:hypothetical protein
VLCKTCCFTRLFLRSEMKQGSAFPYLSYAVARRAHIGFSLMTHCLCHERGTHFSTVPGSTPNTFKQHFVARLSSVDPSFPMHLWDRLLPQAEITLNLLWTSRLHLQLSALQAANKITDNNSHPRHPQCAITSESGHTSDTTSFTSEGAHWLPATLAPQPVSR